MEYHEFISRKLGSTERIGLDVEPQTLGMFPHQIDLTRWALRRGAAAIFADTGLGKTRMQIAWADAVHRATGADVLILAPLAVAEQTASEAASIDVMVRHVRDGAQVEAGISITNYDRLHRFDTSRFGAVVLDESSIIKHHDAKTLQILMGSFRDTPYKLCATATPAPNDWTELGTHAEFLGVRSRAEMLAEFFVHDGGDTSVWRLKGHARHLFWEWVASWGAMVRSPEDLGHDGTMYRLPPVHVAQHVLPSQHDLLAMGLFVTEAQTLMDRRRARRDSIVDRVRACADTVKSEWAKMAATEITGCRHAVEEGIRRSKETESSARPGISGEAELAGHEGQGFSQGIHAGLLQEQPGEVQKAHPGKAGRVQREATGEVCGESGVPRCAAGQRKGMAAGESAQEEISAPQEVRPNVCGVFGPDDKSAREVCDLRASGYEHSEILSGGGPLPQQREGTRTSLHELQHGNWQVQGRSGSAAPGGRVHLEPWLIWCDLNAEQDALRVAFGDMAFSVQGSDTAEHKEAAIRAWLRGERPVMISKVSILGFGLNFQHCANMAFVGVTDSWEAYYQAVRRCWRFGQKREVSVHIFASEAEGAVVANLKRKEEAASAMSESMAQETRAAVQQQVLGFMRETNEYKADRTVRLPSFMEVESCSA